MRTGHLPATARTPARARERLEVVGGEMEVVMKGLTDFPVVLCKPDGERQWCFRCPYCKRYHYHSAGGGLRQPHCTGEHRHGTPFADGYVLRLDPKYELAS